MSLKNFFFIFFYLIIFQIFIFISLMCLLHKSPLCLSVVTCFIINLFYAFAYCEKENIILFYKKGLYLYNNRHGYNFVLYTKQYYSFSAILLDIFSKMINYVRIIFLFILFFSVCCYVGYNYNLF
uniref:Uncharacterized protein n=1 Tax=Cyanophora sudae TaxID=1522369 RepID=A0A873WYL3_9EUKA|nr:hypothetical protein DXZ12_mgp35 [Cyanophora sudae]QPB15071.1 hypothetical protein [Cyanophora sudae]